MNFYSVHILGVLFLGLYNVCTAHVIVTYSKDAIRRLYESKKSSYFSTDFFPGHLVTTTLEDRKNMCQHGRSDFWERVKSFNDANALNSVPEWKKYRINMSLHVFHVYFREDDDNEEKLQSWVTKCEQSQDVGNSQINQLSGDELHQQLDEMQLNVERPESMAMTQKEEACKDIEMEDKEEENDSESSPLVEEIAFACPKAAENDKQLALSYGFAQYMLFISHEIHNKILSLKGIIYLTPEIEDLTLEQLENRYVELRENTEKIRGESSTLLEDIDLYDAISLLSTREKIILCALIFELPYYQAKNLKFKPVRESMKSIDFYETRIIHFRSEQFLNKHYDADCLICIANKDTPTEEEIGITRSYGDDGAVYTVEKFQNNYYIDKMVTNIPVLINLNYATHLEDKIEAIETSQYFVPYGKEERPLP